MAANWEWGGRARALVRVKVGSRDGAHPMQGSAMSRRFVCSRRWGGGLGHGGGGRERVVHMYMGGRNESSDDGDGDDGDDGVVGGAGRQ